MPRHGVLLVNVNTSTWMSVPVVLILLLVAFGGCAMGPTLDESFSDSEILDAVRSNPETVEQLRTLLSSGVDPAVASVDRLMGVVAEGEGNVARWFELMNEPSGNAGPDPGEPPPPIQNSIVWRDTKCGLKEIARVYSLRAPATGLSAARSAGNTYRVFEGHSGEFLGWLPPRSMHDK